MKKITSLSLGFSFLIMSYTGVVLFIAPYGRVSKWLDWHFLGLDKVQHQELHNTSMVTFVVFGVLHIYYNWRAIVCYMQNSTKAISFTNKEFLIAFGLNALFVLGTLIHMPPFQSFLDLDENIKNSWDEKSLQSNNSDVKNKTIKPPPERLGQKTLQELSDMGNIDLQKAITILQSKGLSDITANSKIKDIAEKLGIEKTDAYNLLTRQ